ncbi:MAG: DUF1847 domain-containing protein [Coriobacteriia bacterium]|nr:DUF1847 domain-containing protein [Coriobacteriia bacterium]
MSEGQKMAWFTSADEVKQAGQLVDTLKKAAATKESDAVVKKMREVTASIGKDAAGNWSRAQEVIEFAKRMGCKKVGIAFCAGLKDEAKTMADALASHGFEVCGVACSVEGPCNSVGQAMLLNEMKTDLNVLMGLCIGHDATFIRFSDAPVTPLGIKDKVTCHNPVAALTCNYQRKKLFKA